MWLAVKSTQLADGCSGCHLKSRAKRAPVSLTCTWTSFRCLWRVQIDGFFWELAWTRKTVFTPPASSDSRLKGLAYCRSKRFIDGQTGTYLLTAATEKKKRKNTHKQGSFTVSFTPRCLEPPSCFYYLLTPWIITLNINRVEDKEMKPWPEVNVYTPYRLLEFSLEFTGFQKLMGRLWIFC